MSAGWFTSSIVAVATAATVLGSPREVLGQVRGADADVAPVVARMGEYVASYGARASLIVSIERYTQQLEVMGRRARPRTLLADFAIVKVADRVGWTGFRDVVAVDGTSVADRRDRLLALLTGPPGGEAELRRLADESARYNVGVVVRNLNMPTTALFFFHPAQIGRFTFRHKGRKTIEGVSTVVLDFAETQRPTLVMKRDGTDVPTAGTVWVVPDSGTIVRTKMRLRGFANQMTMSVGSASPADRATPRDTPTVVAPVAPPQIPSAPQPPSTPSQPPPGAGTTTPSSAGQPPVRGSLNEAFLESVPRLGEIESLAEIEVSYRLDSTLGMWLPVRMSELYEGPIGAGPRQPLIGRTTGLATYSDFRQFQTSVRIVVPH